MDFQEIVNLLKDFVIMTVNVMCVMLAETYKLLVPPPMKEVRDQLVLITGAGGALGREMALQLSDAGARLLLTDVSEKDLNETCAAIRARGGDAKAYICDITKQPNVALMAKKIQTDVGHPTMVIHSAGVYRHKGFLDHSPQDLQTIVDVNVMGTFWISRSFLPAMSSSNSGHLVLLSSVLGVMGRPQLAPYCASKFAITGFADALTQELKEDGVDGVKTTIVHPFLVGNISDVTVNIRVPGIFDILTPKEAAEKILQGVRRNQEEIFLPAKLKPLMRINRALPRQVRAVCQKFVEKPAN